MEMWNAFIWSVNGKKVAVYSSFLDFAFWNHISSQIQQASEMLNMHTGRYSFLLAFFSDSDFPYAVQPLRATKIGVCKASGRTLCGWDKTEIIPTKSPSIIAYD